MFDIDNDVRMSGGSGPSPTPSGQLSDPFKNMCLASQSVLTQAPRASQRPPVPLFSQAAPQQGDARGGDLGEANDVPCSQVEYLGTQDFITPADQFGGIDTNEAATGIRQQRSPAQLSPNRIKRARRNDAGTVEEGCHMSSAQQAAGANSQDAGPPVFAAPVRRVAPRLRSPPCYRNVFVDNDSEHDYARWKDPQRNAPSSQLSRFRADFKEVGMLGQGSFSKVFRVRHRLDGREYAVKRTIKEVLRQGPEFLQFLGEVQVLSNVPPHPGVVRYFASWTESGVDGGERLFMQLELCSATLGLHAAMGERVPEADLVEVARQVAAALDHLHTHGIAHLDVKPSNIYLVLPSEEGTGGALVPPGTTFKLGDFGQATVMAAAASGSHEATVNEGDSRYLPLEVMNSDYSRLDKADMFALGAMLYELASGTELPTGGQVYEDLRRGKVPLLPTATTSFMRVVRALLSPNPDDRPSAAKLLQMTPLAAKRPSSAPLTSGAENNQPQNMVVADQQQIKSMVG